MKFEQPPTPQPEKEEPKIEKSKVEQNTEAESKDLTPEQMAQDLTSSYWSKRLGENQSSMEDPNIQVRGGDFDTARCEAYLKNIQEGKFFEEVDISGTYDGEPTRATESSPYDFFKGIADKESVRKYAELFKDKPESVEKRKKQAEEAQKIVDAVEKTQPEKRNQPQKK